MEVGSVADGGDGTLKQLNSPRSSLVYLPAGSSLLLLAAAHKHGIFPHFLNGLPSSRGSAVSSSISPSFSLRFKSELQTSASFISLRCLLLSSAHCHFSSDLRDRRSHGTLQRMQARGGGKSSANQPSRSPVSQALASTPTS